VLDTGLSILWVFLSALGVLISAFIAFGAVMVVGCSAAESSGSKVGSKIVPSTLVIASAAAIVGPIACVWRFSWVTLASLGIFALAVLLVILLLAALGIALDKIQTLRNADTPSAKAPTVKAPKGFLIDWLLPPDLAEEALFNILGRYPYWVEKYGYRKARFIFGSQSFRCVVDYWTDWLIRRLKLLTFLQSQN
jgi:hypothetical protein